MKKYLPLTLVLIASFAVWALLGFPRDFDSASEKIAAALGFFGTIVTTAELLKKTFFDPPAKAAAAVPLAPTDVKGESLKRIRSLGSNVAREQAEADVANVLMDKCALFWEQLEADPDRPILSLSKDGFWLDGLVLTFQQNGGAFPKNDGRVLDQVLAHQWTAEKLSSKELVPVDVLQRQLGELAQWRYPQIRYPNDYGEGSRIASLYSDYERLVERIGTRSYFEVLEPYRNFWRWFFGLFSRDRKRIAASAEKSAVFSRVLLRLPLTLLQTVFGLLRIVVVYPWRRIERRIEEYVHAYHEGTFHERVEAGWYRYEKFTLQARRFFDTFNLRRARSLRRGRSIIAAATKAGILGADDNHIWFAQDYWRDYFAAWYLIQADALDSFLARHVRDRYHRQNPARNEKVAVMAVGLHEAPAEGVKLLLEHDPIVAARCFVTLEELQTEAWGGLKTRMLDRIVQDLKTVEYDGNTGFCLDSIHAMRGLSADPYYARIALDKIPEIYDSSYHPQAAKLVASFGWPVMDLLLTRLRTADRNEQKSILVALGELKDPRAIRRLHDLLQNGKDRLTKVLVAIILGTYFDDPEGKSVLEKYLLYEAGIADKDDNEGDWAWYYFDFCGEKAIAFALDVLERANAEPAYRNPAGYSSHVWEDRFLGKLEREYRENTAVEQMLLDALARADNLRMTRLLVKALGSVKSQKAVPALRDFLRHEDDTVRSNAVNSLNQIGGFAPGSELSGLLYSENLYLVKEVIFALSGLKSLKDIRALIELLDSDAVEKWYDTDDGYPIALSTMEALSAMGRSIREEKEENPDRQTDAETCLNAAAAWCNAHLEDRRPTRHNRTVAYQALWNLYLMKPDNESAREYYSAWIQKHPDDSI